MCVVCVLRCRALRANVWRQLLDIHEAFGLRHQWGGSHSNKTLLCSLGIDTRNIVSSGSRVGSHSNRSRPRALMRTWWPLVLLMGTHTTHLVAPEFSQAVVLHLVAPELSQALVLHLVAPELIQALLCYGIIVLWPVQTTCFQPDFAPTLSSQTNLRIVHDFDRLAMRRGLVI